MSLGSRVEVINNGVDCRRFRPDVNPESIRARYGTAGKFVVLFVGALTRWHAYKGLDVLLSAMRIALQLKRDILLLVVGDGDLRPYYSSIARQLKLENKVVFAGNVPDQELAEYYAASDVLVLPSKDMSEGFGLTLLEANASGRPCVASNTGGIPEVIRDGYNGLLVPPNDPQALAQTIIRLAKDDRKRREMGRNGRRVAVSHDWRIIAKRTEAVYLTAIAG
jgi:glycosyltransferase involved in cell wall biosynthesis